MQRLSRRTRLAVLARSLAVQGSWNYRTLVGTGFAFALLPALRRIHAAGAAGVADAEPDATAADGRGRLEAAVQRHSRLFNSHPYLAPVALGAVARLEAEGADPAMIERFKSALRGALGSLGDRLVWAGWRPACVLLGLTVWMTGAPAWAAATAFLVVYNVGHLALRGWALHVGLRDGVNVARRLRSSRVNAVEGALGAGGAFLLGVAIPLAASGRVVDTTAQVGPAGLALVAAGIGIAVGGKVRNVAVAALVGAAAIGALGGWIA